ncbi:MAG: PAS domain S-box protein [Nitrospirota bacterium]|nr:PAS domain S-box protein [Nitrospirota bacterium]
MAKKPDRPAKSTALRRQAEELLRTTDRDVAAMPVKDVQQLVQELQVHQIELEMQNEELCRTQLALEAARDRYVDLYDFSPAGHLTLDTQGTIQEANLRAGTLLGIDRRELIGQPLAGVMAAGYEATLRRHWQEVLTSGRRQTCEVLLRNEKGLSCWVHLESLAVHEESGPITHWRMALLDVSDRKLAEQAMEAQRAQLDGIISSAMDAIITVDEKQRVLVFNRAAESMFGCPAADAIGQLLDRFIPERYRQAHHGHMSAFARVAVPARAKERVGTLFGLRATGEEFPFEASISHVRVGGKTLFTVILRDITERKRAEDALQASDAFTRSVLDSLSARVCVLDRDGVILQTNESWKTFVRCNANPAVAGDEVGQNYLDVCRRASAAGEPISRLIVEGVVAVLGGSQLSFSAEYVCHSPEEERWFQMRVTPLKASKGVVVSHTDISPRVRMGLELEHQLLLLGHKQEELESLTGKLIEAQEQERRRIARELHDDFNQRLAALAVELETLERTPDAFPEPVVQQLTAVRDHVGQLSDDLHDLAYRLHPSLLEHVGLEVAARDHVTEFTKRTGLPVTLTAREVPGTLSPEVATNLFRVMQESLQNVLKHARATEVTVKLSGSSKGIGLSVRDNGQGFDLERTDVRVQGLGLVSMQERMRLMGGFLRIHSLPTDGTKVCAWIPRAQEGA